MRILERVGDGTIDGGISTPAYWGGKNKAFLAFAGSLNIGSVKDFYYWLKEGSGRSFYDKLYGRYGVKAIPCAILGHEGLWSGKPIHGITDLSGYKARSSGPPGSKVMEKLGMIPVGLPGGEVYTAGERGSINGAEFGTPYIDIQNKFYQIWNYFYYPSFHSPFSVINFLINLKEWNSLPSSQRQTIERICHESVLQSFAEDRKRTEATLSNLESKGVTVRQFSSEIQSSAKAAWREVVAAFSRNDSGFAEIHNSYNEHLASKKTGTIIVKTNLDEANFEISGTKTFQGNGEYWRRTTVPAGTYEISYGNVTDHDPPPASVKVLKAGKKIIFEGYYNKEKDSAPPAITIENPKFEVGKPLKVTDAVLTVEGKVTDPGGVFRVMINDTPARVDEDGRFTSQKIKLKFGENNISISAADLNDNVKKMDFVVLRSSIMEKGEPLPQMVKRWFGKSRSWAVVVGIDDYPPESGFEHLPYAVRDAKAVENFLTENLGFSKNRVKSLYNKDATRKKILQLLGDELPGRVTEEARVLIFFSGHGATRKTGQTQSGYLVPVDGSKQSLHATCIPMTEIRTLSRQFIAKQMLFIVDACYSGLAGRTLKSGTLDDNTREQVEKFIKGGGRHVMTAGRSDETAQMWDIGNGHSVYTYHLLNGMSGDADLNLDGVVTVYELHNYVFAKVTRDASQQPQLRHLDESEGQFVFYREGALD